MGPHPAVAGVRRAVRHGLDGLTAGDLVLAACSGGADSLAGEAGDDVLYDYMPGSNDTSFDVLQGGTNGANGDTLGGAGASDSTSGFEH